MDKRFILVDDVKMNNLMSRLILSTTFPEAEIVEFTDAQEGLDYISGVYTDNTAARNTVLLLDLYMPAMDGWEFLEAFEHLPTTVKNQIKILILTSSISDNDKKKAEKYDCVSGYLIKPFTSDQIIDIFE
jgi:CheY-like chemotaxis protein